MTSASSDQACALEQRVAKTFAAGATSRTKPVTFASADDDLLIELP